MSEANEVFKQAKQLQASGDVEAAIAKLQEAVALDDQHVLSHLTLCRLLSQAGKHEQAIEHGERACQLDPSDPIHFTVLSVTYQRALAATGNMEYMELAERARDRGMMG